MPKISNSKQNRLSQIKNLRSQNPGPTVRNPHKRYQMSRYMRTNIDIWLDLDGTLWENVYPNHPEAPPYLNDLLKFCVSTCSSVNIFTKGRESIAKRHLESHICESIISVLNIYYSQDTRKIGNHRIKVIPALLYKPRSTLIIDDVEKYYANEHRDNLLAAIPNNDFTLLYDEIVSFIKNHRNTKDIREEIRESGDEYKTLRSVATEYRLIELPLAIRNCRRMKIERNRI